jgi:signal peptidase I
MNHRAHVGRSYRAVAARLVAVSFVAVVLVLGAAHALGLGVVALTSASMGPTIPEGSLALTRTVDARALSAGDVVSVRVADGLTVTHRIVDATATDAGALLTLRGDANRTADPAPVEVAQAPRVVASVPWLGHPGVLWLVVGGSLVVVAVTLRRRPRHRRGAGDRLPIPARAGVVGTVLAGVVAAGLAPTSAYWSDVAPATTAAWSTIGSVPSPSAPGCVDQGAGISASWANVGQRYRYRATLHRLGDGAQLGAAVYLPEGTTATITRSIGTGDFGDVSSSGQYNGVVRVHAVPVASTTWVSSSFVSVPVHFTATRSALRCGNDTTTAVAITSLAVDSGSSSTDFVTNTATNEVRGTAEAGATVEVTRDGTPVVTVTADGSGTWTTGSITLTDGSHTWAAKATDYLGNTASTSRTVLLDRVAPTASGSAPCSSTGNAVTGVDGATWCKVAGLTWTGSFADAGGSGLVPGSGQQYENDGAGWTSYTSPVILGERSGRVVRARATDVAGNVSTVWSATYYIDGTPPILAVTQPVGFSLLAATLRSNVSSACGSANAACGPFTDAVSGPATARWSLSHTRLLASDVCLSPGGSYAAANCGSTYPVTISGGQFLVPVATASAYSLSLATTYTLTISGITDAAGNTASALTSTFTAVLL